MPFATARSKENPLRISPRETFSESFAKVNTVRARTDRSDEELLRGMARRDEKALAELFDRFADITCGIAYRILRDQDTSEDVVQAAFLKVWRDADALVRAKTSIAGWLALNTRELAIGALHGRSGTPPPFYRMAYSTDAEPEMLSTTKHLQQVMSDLPSRLRSAVEMAFFDGLHPDEIGAVTDTSACDVAAGLRSSLLRLRRDVKA